MRETCSHPGGRDKPAFAERSTQRQRREGEMAVFVGKASDDVFVGTQENDFATMLAGGDFAYGLRGRDQFDMGAGNDFADGDAGKDTIIGGTGEDELSGGKGADIIYGDLTTGAGSTSAADRDFIDAGEGDDRAYGGNSDDIVIGGEGSDRLFGDRGNDWLEGDAGDDRLEGNAGNDTLLGGQGNDTLSGGGGADHFLVENDPGEAAFDRITDFSITSRDSLALDGYTPTEYLDAGITTELTALGNAFLAEATISVGGDAILIIDGAAQGFIAGYNLVVLDGLLGDGLLLM
jgi:Ca2+-binding RTX toxin-like protein